MPSYGHPDAYVIHPLTVPARVLADLDPAARAAARAAHTDAWHAKRADGVGASDASTLAGHPGHPTQTVARLFAEKAHGVRFDAAAPDQAALGKALEKLCRERFTERTGIHLRRVGMLANKTHPWMRCNPDALTDDGAGWECKTTTKQHSREWDAYPSDHALCQATWSMVVTGARHWWVSVLFRDSGDFKVYRVTYDQRLADHLIDAATTFWNHHVLPRVAPPLTHHDGPTMAALYPRPERGATVEGGDIALTLAARRRAAADLKAQAEQIIEDCDTSMKAMLGQDGTELTAHGQTVATWRHNGNFAHARWAKDHPDEAAQYTEERPVLNTSRVRAASATAPDYIGRRFLTTKNDDPHATLSLLLDDTDVSLTRRAHLDPEQASA